MARLSAALVLAGLLCGCGPTLLGTCQSQADCAPSGTFCSVQGVCIARSGTCSPSCPSGSVCSNSSCAALKPVVSVQPDSTRVEGQGVTAVVRVEAAPGVPLPPVTVRATDAAGREARGTLARPVPGDNRVVLSGPAAQRPDPAGLTLTLDDVP